MENADTVIMIGSRGVCQADCSGIGYPKASKIININGDLDDLNHYANTIGLPGDISEVIEKLIRKLGYKGQFHSLEDGIKSYIEELIDDKYR